MPYWHDLPSATETCARWGRTSRACHPVFDARPPEPPRHPPTRHAGCGSIAVAGNCISMAARMPRPGWAGSGNIEGRQSYPVISRDLTAPWTSAAAVNRNRSGYG